MNRWLLRCAVAAARLWTRVYTSGLPPNAADARRAEVESDLWESAHDPDPDTRSGVPLQIAARLLIGIPDDLGWRLEQEEPMTGLFRRRLAVVACTAGVLGLLIVVWLAQTPDVPRVPGAPSPAARAHVPPPPPPPPPSHAAPGRRADEVPLVYGETSYTVRGMGRAPHKVRDVPPVYPPMAIWGGLEGRVSIEATLDTRGRVADARVVWPSIRMLDQSALDAVKQWEFEPATQNGAPVEVLIVATVDFVRPH